ncbi:MULTISPECIES: protein-glutamate O-methyltransferase CheR [unclassified Leptolyngbya]|uniref:CheR family methyltransferase n=1 Tax=unclassified Leptolyngbya TaxID=2650499 RepID=UPI0016865C51|nr:MULTISPECIES: protein-glutamate O-methyltransferase CheR [unclassified Leptolyngbya]MBD1911728.1 hypothetical protein [Leptolyngbya sp. FACHB-8]MBD2157327.1 hypothetical protein [Leptolyngbya sp. FACHB-16]
MHNLSVSTTSPSLKATNLEDLLNHLKHVQKADLTSYKRSSLMRQIKKRMQHVGAQHYQEYLDHLTQQPDEVTHLLNAVFINCTFFFRDRPIWDYLKSTIIPQIIANKAPNELIRIWSAGCASGEETYSLAILLAEALGVEQFQQRVQIYGTDIDADALWQAQRGCYFPYKVTGIPPELLERYFECTAEGYRWRQELYHSVTFHQHDLIQSPPLSHIDLLLCRNTLMYLIPQAQLQALVRFHFSLQQQGFLLLGMPEGQIPYLRQSLFESKNSKVRLFTKGSTIHDYYSLLPLSFCPIPAVNNALTDMNEAGLKHLSDSTNASQDYEQQHVQLEMLQLEVKRLQDQVRSLQDALSVQIQQRHDIEQELRATQKELELMNQEIHRHLRAKSA